MQTLQLAFVRPAARSDRTSSLSFVGTAWDVSNIEPSTVRSTDVAGSPVIVRSNFESSPVGENDTRAFLYELNIAAENRVYVQAIMNRVADPIDLARVSARDKDPLARAALAALASGRDLESIYPSLKAGHASLTEFVSSERRTLALLAVLAAMYRDFLPSVASAISQVEVDSTSVAASTTVLESRQASSGTFGDLFIVAAKLEAAFASAKLKHMATFAADISAANGSSAGVIETSIEPAISQISANDINLMTNFQRLLDNASDTSSADPFQSGSAPFGDRWNRMFRARASQQPLTSADHTEASRVLRLLSYEVKSQISGAKYLLDNRAALREAVEDLKGISDKMKEAKGKKTKALPQAQPNPLGDVPK
jgi:hypothetical protein